MAMVRVRAVGIVGSPKKKGNTDILVSEILRGAKSEGARTCKILLNDLDIRPCQSCDVDPNPKYCIIDDDMKKIYSELESCDVVIVGSPIYFDNVTAQTKLMIDRCNCLMPYIRRADGTRGFERRMKKSKKGVFVAVGGKDQRLECAITTIGGLFHWANIRSMKTMTYLHDDDELGGVTKSRRKMNQAFALGRGIVRSLGRVRTRQER